MGIMCTTQCVNSVPDHSGVRERVNVKDIVKSIRVAGQTRKSVT